MTFHFTGTQTDEQLHCGQSPIQLHTINYNFTPSQSTSVMYSTPAQFSTNPEYDMKSKDETCEPSFNVTKISYDTDTDMDFEDSHECFEEHFIASKNSLWQLLEECPKCTKACLVNSVHRNGTFVSIEPCCICEYSYRWDSQQLVKNQPMGNSAVCAAIRYNGASLTKVLNVFKTMLISIPCYTTYWKIQTILITIQPTVFNAWRNSQGLLFDEIRAMGSTLEVAGNCRTDSLGHSATFGTYSLFDTRLKKVIDFQFVQVRL